MKMRFLILGALCAVMVGACNGNDGTPPGGKAAGTDGASDSQGMKILGGCQNDQQHVCMQVSYSGTPPAGQDASQGQAKLKESCEHQRSTFVNVCTGGSLGGCRSDRTEGAFTSSVTSYFYAGGQIESTERVKQICGTENATFVTN